MAGWGFEEPLALAIDCIANDLNKSSEAASWKATLESNGFDSVGSLQALNSADWTAMGIPLRVLTELRKKQISNPHKLVPKEKKIEKSSKKVSNASPKARAPTVQNTPFPDILPLLSLPSSAPKSKKDSSVKNKNKKVVPTKEKIKSKVLVIGKDNFPSQFVQQILGVEVKAGVKTSQVVVYGQEVEIEFYDTSKSKTDSPNAIILLFSKVNPIMALTEVNEKVQNAINQLKTIPFPIFLVAYDPEYKASIEKRMDWIKDLVEQIKPFRLLDIRSQEQGLKDILTECAYYSVRNAETKLEINHKIFKAIDKRTPEVSLKKSSITLLPNAFLGLAPFVNKLSLEGNLFKYFPMEVLALQHLQELNLSSNQIEELPNEISKLQYLVKLDVDNNNLDSLPIKSLQSMKYLEEFKGRLNPLSKVPEEIVKSKNDLLLCIKQYVEKPPMEIVPENERFKIFGVPLNELMANELRVNPSTTLPRFVRNSINHTIKFGLAQEGVFRLAGQSVQCGQLKEDLDKGMVSFQDSEYIHNVTSLLKSWLRELPEPLFLFENYQSLVNISSFDKSEETQIEEIKKILTSLPKYNFDILRSIFRVMYYVFQSSEVNRMDAANVAKVVGPNLIYSQHPKDPFETMSDIDRLNDTLTLITTHYPLFFEENVDLFDSESLLLNNKIGILYRITCRHSKSVIGLAITSDNQLLWSADSKGILHLSTTKDLSHVKEVDISSKKRINCLTQCGQNIWVGFMDCIQIRDEISGDLVKEIEKAPTFNFTVVNQKDIWVGDAGKIIVYDGSTFESKEIPANCLVLSLIQVGDQVWGACGDKKIRIWSISSKELIYEFDCPQGKINGLAFINEKIWSCSDDSSICIWDVEKREVIKRLETTSKVFGSAKIGNHAWTYSWDGIRVYDCENFEAIGNVATYHHDAIGSIVSLYDPERKFHRVFTGSWDQSIICWLTKS